jgi:Ca-activated chloride channel family protein
MIEFTRPWLLLLAPAALLLGWLRLCARGPALGYSSLALFAGLPQGKTGLARWVGAGARTVALLLLVVALAGPRWPDRKTRLPAEGIAIEVVLDTSGSMSERDFSWQGRQVSRLEAAQEVLRRFVVGGAGPEGQGAGGRPDDLVGLITFARWPRSACPLTLSHPALVHILDAQQPELLPTESQTNIGDSLCLALDRLQSAPNARRVIVLITDGEHNVPPPALTPRQAAQLAANLRVPVYVIDAGGGEANATRAPGALTARAVARRSLEAVAGMTGGRYFAASDAAGLNAVCGQIDRLERTGVPSFSYRRYSEGYALAALVALVLWVGVLALEQTVWRRLP